MKKNTSKFKIQNSKSACLPFLTAALVLALLLTAAPLYALSSANIPLDSPVYGYLDKLAGFGLISSDIKGIKPFSKAEAARLLLEAEKNLAAGSTAQAGFAEELIRRVREL